LIFLYLNNAFMNAWKFDWIWISGLNDNACLSAWNLIFFCFEECSYECLKLCEFFWMKMHPWMHEFFLSFWFCYFFFEKCIYECVKFYEFFEWKCMLKCMSYFCLFDIVLFFEKRMHLWIHKTWFFFVLLFLKNGYINAWNSIFFSRMYVKMNEILFLLFFILNENACLNSWYFIFDFLGR